MQPGNQANVEYWFRLLYDCLRGACYGSMAGFSAFFANLWLWIIGIGYLLSVVALVVIVYCTVRLFDLRRREEEYYGTPLLAPDTESGGHPRWRNISSLADGAAPSGWREAIIEADIMLDEMLTEQGYTGESVGEKLKSVERSDFTTLQDAWEAHKVRNQIAHEGSAFNLSAELTRRTIARYESVFREFKII
ncbi:MAG TPA: hypothetical protein VNF51_02120 [Candidatus Paceibacterota bacterium]|nr:hypothetical protein [Candidatus Paceibacterota bacterium]